MPKDATVAGKIRKIYGIRKKKNLSKAVKYKNEDANFRLRKPVNC